ncbi:MAG: FAD-dependent thymidylate synthase, partial [Patescibacteria group bacterium]
LKMPAEIAQKLVDKKDARSYTDKKRDIHEADINHLRKSVEVYDDMCHMFPKDFQMIECVRGGKVMTKDKIQKLIWETIMPLLPPKNSKVQKPTTNKPANPYIEKTESGIVITDEGKRFLEQTVTNPEGQVYGFYDKLSPITIAAAMARLSRRADDMRVTILDEFTSISGKDEALLKRVITAYGDDSVQQLVGQHIVVEDASNLLTKKLEWGRIASYLEQSTRYIYFDQKDKNGKYRYFTPTNFDKKTTDTYNDTIDQIFTIYSQMARTLTEYVQNKSTVPKEERDMAWKGATRAQACDAIRAVLPVATKATVGIFASGQALESLILHLMSDNTREAREVGKMILDEARKTVPAFLERADKPDRGGAFVAYRQETAEDVKKLAKKVLKNTHSKDQDSVELVGYWPKNELDLVSAMLYEHTGLSLSEIKKKVDKLTYDDKKKVFDSYVGKRLNRRHKPGRA